MKKLSNGVYFKEVNGHTIYVKNLSGVITGQLVWGIICDTLNLEDNTERMDTFYSTKKECVEVLQDIVNSSPIL